MLRVGWSQDHPDLKKKKKKNNNNNKKQLFEYPLKKNIGNTLNFFMLIKLNFTPLFVLLSSKTKKPKQKFN